MIQSILPKSVTCPFSIEVSNEAENENHFHSELELVFLLRGTMTYLSGNNRYKLRTKDFIFANPYENHTIRTVSDDGCYVRILIQESRLRPLFSASKTMTFEWQESLNNRTNPLYQEIADGFCKIMLASANPDAVFSAKVYQQVLRMLVAIWQHCPAPADIGKDGHKSQNLHHKSCEIMDYINSHFAEEISLNSISQALFLSPPYISKIFKENFDVGVLEYINRLRVQKAMVLLCTSNSYISDIAQECGFATTNTFSRLFLKETGLTPSDYRRQHTEEEKPENAPLFLDTHQDYLSLLDLGSEADVYSAASEHGSACSVSFDFTQDHRLQKPRPWNKVLYAGTAELLIHRSAQETVQQAIKDFEVEYVRFVAPFADSMQSYDEDANGNPRYFWGLLDEVLHFLLENKVKPFIVLGYMPQKLAASATPSPFHWAANTGAPKSMEKWTKYLTVFLRHIVHLFSYEEVCSWRFEFWNDPAMEGVFWHGSQESFQSFLLSSYKAFRSALPDGQFGSPSFTNYNHYRQAADLLGFCKQNHVKFDFLCLHSFELTDPKNPGDEGMNRFGKYQVSDYHGAQFVAESFKEFQALAAQAGYTVPIYITEWNVSPYSHDYSRDTAFMAAYIMETINSLPEAVASISFWSLMDYTTDFNPNQSVFTGEFGMRTTGSLPKSSYLAFRLLKWMQGNVIETGDGYRITKSKYGLHIAMHNYSFFNEDFLSGTSRPLSRTDRYQIFDSRPPKKFYLNLTLRPGRYRIERYILDREHGSIYDGWIRMGAPEFIDKACFNYLNKIAYPEMSIQYKDIQGKLVFAEQVPQHGVMLLSLIRLGDV